MDERLREQLVGYALGALDDDEQLELEERLAADPHLRRELESVQQSLEPLAEEFDAAGAFEERDPPPGLAAQACAYVASEADRLQITIPGVSLPSARLETRSRWKFADWVVVGGIGAAALLLFFPAALNSRLLARVQLCQNNLRELGTSLVQYAEYHGEGSFPHVPTEGNRAFAGFYGPTLAEHGLLPDSNWMICPGSSWARRRDAFRVPTVEEIDAAQGEQLLILQQMGGGSYASNLGVVLNGRHQPIRNRSRSHFALMADAPQSPLARPVHDRGQNILYEDLHISFVVNGPNLRLIDDPFSNRYGRREAGVDIDDAVVAPSDYPPIRSHAILSVSR